MSGGLLFANTNAAEAFVGLLLLGGYGEIDIPIVLVRAGTSRQIAPVCACSQGPAASVGDSLKR